jgi:hypothetical protein
MENEFTKKEAKNHKEASEQGVKQTLEKYWFPASYYAWKRKWKQWAKRVFSWNDPDQLNGFENWKKE